MRATALLPLLLLAAPLQAQFTGHVIVVDDDGGPGVDFTAIQPAVDAALEGDRILVADGVYPGFVVKGKSVSVEANQGAQVEVRGPVEVRELAGSQWSFLRGLHASEAPETPATEVATLHANSGVGHIWVERCSFGAPHAAADAATTQGARLILVGVELTGGAGRAGLAVKSSNVWAHRSRFVGGDGAPAEPGGAGIAMEAGFLFLAGSELVGGGGGDAADPVTCPRGGDGGAGLRLAGLFPVYEGLDNSLSGGAGGSSLCGAAGSPGPGLLDLAGGLINEHPGAAVSVSSSSPMVFGDVQTLTVDGAPGDVVLLVYSFFADTTDVLTAAGPLLVLAPYSHLGRVELPASGTLSLAREVPALTFPKESFTLHVQPVALRADGQIVAGAPSAFGILPQPF
ncbi:MAG: hypothetical protein AAF682_05485 [Planctomycetota bacterium]